jgi:hypothetical protein
VAETTSNDQSSGELLDLDEVDLISDAGSVTALLERMHDELGDAVIMSQATAEEARITGMNATID